MSSSAYTLSRGYLPSARLDLQHYLWTQETGFLLHPAISASTQDNPNIKIADIGTGTAIWLLDLARRLPQTAQLDGFDISLSQCPPAAFLPRNVKCHELDAFTSDLPPQYRAAYDVVNIRLFVFACPNGDAMPLLRNAVAMLKPGGWLQWAESDAAGAGSHPVISEPDEAKALEKYYACRQYFIDAQTDGGKPVTPLPTWIPRLDSLFEGAGLRQVTSQRGPTSTPFLMVWQEIVWLTMEELSHTLDGQGKGEGLRRLIREGYEESRRGNVVSVDRFTVVGQKPLEG